MLDIPSAEAMAQKEYKYIVGIDFGTFSTSFSFAYIDDKQNIITVDKWAGTNDPMLGRRFLSSILYEAENELPQCGYHAIKDRYNKEKHFFYTPNIKLYLTDIENQPKLPNSLTPLQMVADYLKEIHKLGVKVMKDHYSDNNDDSLEEKIAGLSIKNTENFENDKKEFFEGKDIQESQIRYVLSYPEKQQEDYRNIMKEALVLAKIISPDDPEERLEFITESEATAYFCFKDRQIERATKPYLVCDIGGTVLGLSAIHAPEISETGTVKLYIDNSNDYSNNNELDKNMRRYLEDKITASQGDIDLLKQIRDRVFDFYIENIKQRFEDNYNDYSYYMDEIMIDGTTIRSECINNNTFVFQYEDMRDKIFGPVTETILSNIQRAIKSLDSEISNVVISGEIGQTGYLQKLVDERFRTANINVYSIKKSWLSVSEGLVAFGFRKKNQMVPYFMESFTPRRNHVKKSENELITGDYVNDTNNLDLNDTNYVIGLDFGTTYSGFAYAKAKHCNDSNADHTLVIKEVKNWPKQTYGNNPKVPSTLFYDRNLKYQDKFGEEANAAMRNTKSGVLLSRFKLLLAREFNPSVDHPIYKQLEDFQVIDAITNYLRDFNKEGINRLKRQEGRHFSSSKKVCYIITIPAMWPDEAKNTMRVAIEEAKLLPKEEINSRVIFITEAEAAALYCERYFKDDFIMNRGKKFMICDAGGGTVDLVTFEVAQEETGNQKLVISELTSGDGGDCGSIYLDEAFKNFIISKFEEHNINYKKKEIESLVDHFIREKKPNFEHSISPHSEENIEIYIPSSLGIPYDAEAEDFIKDGIISISYTDMENIIFKPIVDSVLDLIDKQLRKLPEGERQLDAIMLVGGFGRSSYLLRKVRDRFENKIVGAGFIGQPPDGDLAICRGAVSFGLEPRMVAEGYTRYSYGLQVKDTFSRRDDPVQKIIGYNGDSYCRNVFSTIITNEVKLKKGTIYGQRVFITYPLNPIFVIYSTKDKNVPRLTNGLPFILKINVNIPKIPLIKAGDKVVLELWFEISGTEINAEIYYNSKKLEEGVTYTENIVKKKVINSKSREKKSRIGFGFFLTK